MEELNKALIASKAIEQRPFWWFLRPNLRFKMTIPYITLAILLALAGAYVISRLVFDSLQERFLNQLVESGRMVTDGVVKLEQKQLATLRAIAYTQGMGNAVQSGNAEDVRLMALPIVVNDNADVVDVVRLDGQGLLAIHHRPGSTLEDYQITTGGGYDDWPLVQRVLRGERDNLGDKFADLVDAPWGYTLYVAGPIKVEGQVVGAVLVGSYLGEMVRTLRLESAAHVTVYNTSGKVLATTMEADYPDLLAITPNEFDRVLAAQDTLIFPNDITVRGREYSRIFGPFEARRGRDLAVFSAALPRSFIVRSSPITRLQLIIFIMIALLAVIAIGVSLAQQITRPILELVLASRRVAQGNLEHKVAVHTSDEVGLLAESFNQMVDGLKEGKLYGYILGRMASPEVSEALKNAFISGELELTGQQVEATILFCDIRGFTTLSEQHDPPTIVSWLNEYFDQMAPIIARHGGVIDSYGGDSIIAYFGILPERLPPADSAHRAVSAAIGMLDHLAALNDSRRERGEPPLGIGIGINTGEVVAGLIGSEERWSYTVIGDAVNVTSRIEGLTRKFDADILISHDVLQALGPSSEFILKSLGETPVKGKARPVRIYAVIGRRGT
jgi:class 3 adenylate cyclase